MANKDNYVDVLVSIFCDNANIGIVNNYLLNPSNDELYQQAIDEINYNMKNALDFLTGDSVLISISNLLKSAISNGNIQIK